MKLFLQVLDHKVKHGDINLSGGQEDIRQRLENLARQSFSLYRSLHPSPSRTETSSSTNHQPSLVGGSSTQPSAQTGSSTQPMTTTTMTSTAPPQPSPQFAFNMQSNMPSNLPSNLPPTGGPYMSLSMSRAPSFQAPMAPAGIGMPNFPQVPQDAVNGYLFSPMVFRQPWPSGVPYPGIPGAFNPAGHLPPEFYSSPGPEDFGPGQDGDFNNV